MSEKTLCKENDIKLTTKDQDQKKKKRCTYAKEEIMQTSHRHI